MSRLVYTVLLLSLLATPASSDDFIADGDGYTLSLPDTPLAEIQEYHGRMRDAKQYEEQVALLIAMGHSWHEQIRDSQQKLVWYIGRIHPDIDIPGDPTRNEADKYLRYEIPYRYMQDILDRYAKPFDWSNEQELVLVFKDGRRLSAELIIASEGIILDLNPYKPRKTVYIYPLERPLRFTDFLRILPSRDHYVLPIWCGFPRRPRIDGKPWCWDPKDVVAIELHKTTEGTEDEKTKHGSSDCRNGINAVHSTD